MFEHAHRASKRAQTSSPAFTVTVGTPLNLLIEQRVHALACIMLSASMLNTKQTNASAAVM
jgi:hypothetical protein